ncbi:hypothetical protein ACH4SK_43145 [Streptomyces inhibens]|uniref:hypothetical protein n=1 Tax=Streptomyces inhibens TaxID=2293571 RepID=UPI0037914FB7
MGVPEAPVMVETRALRTHARRHGLPEPTRTRTRTRTRIRIRIRMDDGFLPVPALDAYDAVVSVPRTTLSADLAESAPYRQGPIAAPARTGWPYGPTGREEVGNTVFVALQCCP